MSLEYKIIEQNSNVNISENDFNNLLKIISWDNTPSFEVPGRTGWYILETPVLLSDGRLIKALKLKGIGLWNPEGRNYKESQTIPIPPTTEIYRRQSQHLGIDNKGKIKRVSSEDSPYGGILFRRAKMEYDNEKILYENNISANIPFLLVEYSNISFNDEKLGLVISACVEVNSFRLMHLGWEYKYVPEYLQNFYEKIALINNISESLNTAKGKLELSMKIGFKYGKAIRGMTESNLYIHSGGWDNLQYDIAGNNIVLTDLDSTRTNENLSNKVKAICGVRDLVSCIYRFVNKLYYPKAITVYEMNDLINYDVVGSMICGYFKDIDKEICIRAAMNIWKYFSPYFCEFKKFNEELIDIPKSIRKKIKMDLDLFYLVCLHYLYPIMIKSKSILISEESMTENEYENSVKEYLGNRFIYYELAIQ